jgi:hypothetical protein
LLEHISWTGAASTKKSPASCGAFSRHQVLKLQLKTTG